jgi:hypothetical protein
MIDTLSSLWRASCGWASSDVVFASGALTVGGASKASAGDVDEKLSLNWNAAI